MNLEASVNFISTSTDNILTSVDATFFVGSSAPNVNISEVDTEIFNAMNSIRKQSGLPLFKQHSKLKEAAQKHADYMRDNVRFSHYGPNQNTWIDRAKAAGYNSSSVGEDIGYGQTTAEQIIGDWMSSPGHKAQIVSKSNVHIGSGVAFDPTGRGYWCTDFGFGVDDDDKNNKAMNREDFKFL